jgi:hypothetical protein
LDKHSERIQTAHLQRNRVYDDELQHFDRQNPSNAPSWTYIEQDDLIYDTEAEKGYVSAEGDEEFEEEEDDDEGKEKDELGNNKEKGKDGGEYEEEELLNSENLGNMEGSSKGITKDTYDESYYWFE